jgi:rubrerythrin
MKTSKEWWDEVKVDNEKLVDWLKRQYRGEVSAVHRLQDVKMRFEMNMTAQQFNNLSHIGSQEAQHARWIKELLEERGIRAEVDKENAQNRYWSAVDLSYNDFVKTMAVGAHAERMRLHRIWAIAEDRQAPWDIREVFMKIRVDEEYHAKFFAEAAGTEALEATADDHEAGKRLLGLEA